ncbi:MAG: hypothetical protein ACK4NY_14955 [Spirosomataceae bacterium]
MKTNSKKIMKSVVLAIGIAAISNATFAQSKLEKDVTPVEASATEAKARIEEVGQLKFKVLVSNPSKQKTAILLRDEEGNVLFSQYLNSSYNRTFDLNNLSDGKYKFIVIAGRERLNREFTIETKTSRTILAKN